MYKEAEINEDTRSKLPTPSGYHLLVAMPKMQDKTKGGVFIPDKTKTDESTASILGFVLATGPDAYADLAKFPTGAWCKEGDWVIFRSYSGTRFKIDGQEFRLINDDTVEATVENPVEFSRA